MKQASTILTIFILAISFAFGQKQQSNTISSNNKRLIENLKKTVGQKWIKKNPSLNPTKPSFFNDVNEHKYFVSLMQISGQGEPFTWDDNLSLLQFLLSLSNEIEVKHGTNADQTYKGTKIRWTEDIEGIVWFNNKTYKAKVDNWHLIGFTDCPETIIFPSLSFEKVAKITNAITNDIQGLAILPFNDKLKSARAETPVKTVSGQVIEGDAYDIDNDGIFDIFIYVEEISETATYTRLFLNINGQWKCKWINLDEDCI